MGDAGVADLSDLVRAAGQGDQHAWDGLVERFAGLVWHVARGHRLSEADAADVSQTVWLRLVESLPRLREPAALGGWLSTTTRHECLRLLRRSGREVSDAEIDLTGKASDDQTPEAAVEAGERRLAVRRALDRLPIRCQSLLRALAVNPDSSYIEISAALDMPVGSIGPTRGRCLEQLRRSLGDHDPTIPMRAN